MKFSIKKLGNFPQFWKEEFFNILHVAKIGILGACMIILLEFKNKPDKLNYMLPTQLPTISEPYVKPYAVEEKYKHDMGMLQYLFSYDSDFPYNIKIGIDIIDGYFLFFGGMGTYLYSSYRYAIKYIIEYINTDNFLVDLFCFYILPTIVLYGVLIPIIPIISFFVINFISCLYQPLLKSAFIYSFAFIFNALNYNSIKAMMDVDRFPNGIIQYCMHVVLGFLMTFILVPVVSAIYSINVWIYVVGFFYLSPLYLVYMGGLTWSEFGNKIIEQLGRHYSSLTILFLYYSISIAYKNLDQKVAWGTKIGIVMIILILLRLLTTFKNIYNYFKGDITTFPNPITDMMSSGIEMKDLKKD
uniref:Uncharacterized protein n=1 Tax=viral metagenome TaxID=1070528 RepID=A0A6C0B9T7_9ZZZZ